MRKSTVKKNKNYGRYSKGLRLRKEIVENKIAPRVCVAFDVKGSTTPYLYVLSGAHTSDSEKQLRRVFAKTASVNYYDTRVVLYSTFVKRMKEGELKFANAVVI